MIRILKLLKYKFPSLWLFIEYLNGFFLYIFFNSDVRSVCNRIIRSKYLNAYSCRLAKVKDINSLIQFINELQNKDFQYFKPFKFDRISFRNVITCGTYQLFIVSDINNRNIIGFFFIRFFINKKCFLGFIVDPKYRGKGIGKSMIKVMAESINQSKFTLYSTVCKENISSIKAHLSAALFTKIEELPSNEIVFKLKKYGVNYDDKK